jgi:GntR family transcriptional regulator
VITQPLGALYSLFASVESAGLRQTSTIRGRDLRADGVIANRLGLEASTSLFRMERLRLAGGEPLALGIVWLPGDLGAQLLDADFTHPRGGADSRRAARARHPVVHRRAAPSAAPAARRSPGAVAAATQIKVPASVPPEKRCTCP